jgi:hypothetical protein
MIPYYQAPGAMLPRRVGKHVQLGITVPEHALPHTTRKAMLPTQPGIFRTRSQ